MPSIVTKSFQQVDFDMHPRSPFQNLSFGLECPQETLGLTTFSHSWKKIKSYGPSTLHKVHPLWHYKQVSMSSMIISWSSKQGFMFVNLLSTFGTYNLGCLYLMYIMMRWNQVTKSSNIVPITFESHLWKIKPCT